MSVSATEEEEEDDDDGGDSEVDDNDDDGEDGVQGGDSWDREKTHGDRYRIDSDADYARDS